jgi:putative endonuclease
MRQMYVYILTNKYNTVFYTGVTNNIRRRLGEHRRGDNPKSFSKRYNLTKLVYVEWFPDPTSAIAREKQLKRTRRERKLQLILGANPQLMDLGDSL